VPRSYGQGYAGGRDQPRRPTDSNGGDAGSFRYRTESYRATQGERVVPPHPSRADFHSHSKRSDGVMAPTDLIAAAAAAGVKAMALTDHDTVAGVRELCAPSHPPLPLELIAGVEINSIAHGRRDLWEGELHILGIGIDLADEAFEATMAKQRAFRATRFNRIVDRLRMLGYPVDDQAEQYLSSSGGIAGAALGRPQIARFLVEARYASSVNDAMQRLLSRGKPAYIPRQGLGPGEAISAIRAAGGLPTLAHFAEADERFEVVKELANLGLGGLEVYYRHFDMETIAQLQSVARDLRLVPTGGSDYHGDLETYAEAHASLFVPDDVAADVVALSGRRGAASIFETPAP
jgi:predicted metal-dependent phosphoesterase TrpH